MFVYFKPLYSKMDNSIKEEGMYKWEYSAVVMEFGTEW
jgi:hypothetical protein